MGGSRGGVCAPGGKNMIFWREIVINEGLSLHLKIDNSTKTDNTMLCLNYRIKGWNNFIADEYKIKQYKIIVVFFQIS
jgi:hypothetical protein